MSLQTRMKLIAAALLVSGAVGGANAAQEKAAAAEEENAWSAPQNGVALRLRPSVEEMREDGKPNTDLKARLEFTLLVRNASGKPVTIHQGAAIGAHQVQWEIRDAKGGAWSPTFLPPPMPRPPGAVVPPPPTKELRAGEVYEYGCIYGISGFRSVAEKDGPWLQVLPAGTYTIVAKRIRLGGLEGEFTSGPAVLRVRGADDAVSGLKLSLEADAAGTTTDAGGRKIRPIPLRLTFHNVGDKPLKLDLYDLVWSRLEFDIRGEYIATGQRMVERDMRAPLPADYPTLAPGAKLKIEQPIPFPGEVGRHVYTLQPSRQPYRIRVTYAVPDKEEPGQPLSAGRWAGRAASNEVRLLIREAGSL